jgi:Ca2+-binding RTX toxin-like protein
MKETAMKLLHSNSESRAFGLLESLESRRLMSATLLSGGFLSIIGTESADNIQVDTAGGTIHVGANFVLTGTFPSASVTKIGINARGGDDFIKMWPAVTQSAFIETFAGNDTIFGTKSADNIDGGIGNDYISGADGADTLWGSEGNDTIAGGNQNDFIYDAFPNSGSNYLFGDGGNDSLYAGSGNDWLDGGSEHDYMSGGAGNDTLRGGTGLDKMYGGAGDDFFYARDNTKDRVDGGAGFDTAQVDRSFISTLFSDDRISIERLV